MRCAALDDDGRADGGPVIAALELRLGPHHLLN